MRKNLYGAFTLVEMLIVMGILIILMAVGITAGRFAINRANDVAHQNAADQIYTALQAYYTDEREFPAAIDCGAAACTPETLIAEDTYPLYKYMDQGSFNGGTEATYYYFVETTQQQSVLVCVTLGGVDDAKELGLYCTGNGFNDTLLLGGLVTGKEVPFAAGGVYNTIVTDAGNAGSDWDGKAWGTPA